MEGQELDESRLLLNFVCNKRIVYISSFMILKKKMFCPTFSRTMLNVPPSTGPQLTSQMSCLTENIYRVTKPSYGTMVSHKTMRSKSIKILIDRVCKLQSLRMNKIFRKEIRKWKLILEQQRVLSGHQSKPPDPNMKNNILGE